MTQKDKKMPNYFKKAMKSLKADDNLRNYTINGILFTLVTIFSRTYAIKFMDRLGATSIHYSLMNSLPGFVAIFTTIPGILYIQKNSNARKTMSVFFTISRFAPLLLVFVPYLPFEIRAYMFVIIYSLMNLPESISQTAFQSFTGEVFKPDERANGLSVRNKFSQIIQIIFMIIAGVILSIPKTNPQVIMVYQIFIVLSVIIGVFEIKYLNKLKVTNENPPSTSINLKKSITKLMKYKEYQIFLVCSLLFHFGWQMGWPLMNYYQVSILKADEKWLTIINVMSSLFMVLSYSYWSRMIKKKGFKYTTAIVCAGMAISPILYAVSYTVEVNALMNISFGIFVSGISLVIIGSLLESSDPEEIMLSVAIHTTLTNITLFISPLFGEWLLKYTNNVYLSLYVSAALRFLGAVAFWIRYKMTPNDKNKDKVGILRAEKI